MPFRIDHTVAMQITRDTNQKQKVFFSDLTAEAVTIATLDNAFGGGLSVAVSSTDSLSLGDIGDARGLYLEVDADCNVRLNGGVEDIPITVAPGGARAKFFIEGTITAVTVENTSGTVVLTGAYCFWGDPTP